MLLLLLLLPLLLLLLDTYTPKILEAFSLLAGLPPER
jgi:hypothetical protein